MRGTQITAMIDKMIPHNANLSLQFLHHWLRFKLREGPAGVEKRVCTAAPRREGGRRLEEGKGGQGGGGGGSESNGRRLGVAVRGEEREVREVRGDVWEGDGGEEGTGEVQRGREGEGGERGARVSPAGTPLEVLCLRGEAVCLVL